MNKKQIMVLENKIHQVYENMAGLVVLKDHTIVYEQYFNGCNANSTIHICSVTKSILSLLIGIAIDKGYIESIDQKILNFYPDYKVNDDNTTISNITIKDMITMTAPYVYQEEPYIEYFTNGDGVTFSLALLGGAKSNGEFRYAALVGPDILSGILVKATRRSVLDFAREFVFTPLHIEVKQNLYFQNAEEQMAFQNATNMSGWVMDVKGIHTAGWGLTLTPVAMANIGQLYLSNGEWEGKQLVSREWIQESTVEHSRWKELNLPYGYLWWIHEDGFMAVGDGGNAIYVNRKHNLVVAVTAFNKPDVDNMVNFIKSEIEPLFLDLHK